ncbi:MAG: hypothetical protein H7070_16655 [Saprospiraceae bacterium]|nr:hypothetical protein [Pyrinomonadaceae bacterium]
MSILMSLARRNQEPEPSNITYFYDNCYLAQLGLSEQSLNNGTFGIGLIMQRIVDEKKMSFVKIVDPVITHRLQRAFYQKTKFRKMTLLIQEGVTGYNFKFEDVRVTNLNQKFESGIVTDIVSIEVAYAESR